MLDVGPFCLFEFYSDKSVIWSDAYEYIKHDQQSNRRRIFPRATDGKFISWVEWINKLMKNFAHHGFGPIGCMEKWETEIVILLQNAFMRFEIEYYGTVILIYIGFRWKISYRILILTL